MNTRHLLGLFLMASSGFALSACPGPVSGCEEETKIFEGTLDAVETEYLQESFWDEDNDEFLSCLACSWMASNRFGITPSQETDCEVTLDLDGDPQTGAYACAVVYDSSDNACEPITVQGDDVIVPNPPIETDCGFYDPTSSISEFGGNFLVFNYNPTWDDYSFTTDDGYILLSALDYQFVTGGNLFNTGEQLLQVTDASGAVVGETCLEFPETLAHSFAFALPTGDFYTEVFHSCPDPAHLGSDPGNFDPECLSTIESPVPKGGVKLRVIDTTGESHRYLRFSTSQSDVGMETWLEPNDFTNSVYSELINDVSMDQLGDGPTCVCFDDDSDYKCDNSQLWPIAEVPGSKDEFDQYWALMVVSEKDTSTVGSIEIDFLNLSTASGPPLVTMQEVPSSGAIISCESAYEAYLSGLN